jgi:xylose isomerase
MHYGSEISEESAEKFARSIADNGLYLSMISPAAHGLFAYGGLASPDRSERDAAREFVMRGLALLTGPLQLAANPDCPPVFDLWNGSLGYDLPTALVMDMQKWTDEAIGEVVAAAARSGTPTRVGIEPKPSEGHPALLFQTSSDVLALRGRLGAAGMDVSRFGLINEFGHTEMAGLELAQEYAAALLEGALVHVHANSQGADGIRLGGAGKYDIDYGLAPSASVLAIAQMLSESSYSGWIEHDMQPRPYDGEQSSIDRVVRAICNWEAVMHVVESGALERGRMLDLASTRRTMEMEDLLRDAVCNAHALSKELYHRG